jgi:hypothetical protein
MQETRQILILKLLSASKCPTGQLRCVIIFCFQLDVLMVVFISLKFNVIRTIY